ncbi:DoxX family protein [Nonomuraea terrae]|uniref:DoxX family protein n=1 Tax=Nonomuraea terrae TaxID=2530383 RepID=A0A4R4Z7C9_9ACTN|nr:DoxX family protein [Nonomuraea terrae]TDD52062.1 DoxX family protein [Nonomuraea terrae]
MDFGPPILRVVLGALLAGHGLQKLFGWFGGHGLAGTASFFDSAGFRPGRRPAPLAGLTETLGGVLLIAGLLTPPASAMVIGVMLAACAVHLSSGLWNTEGGVV